MPDIAPGSWQPFKTTIDGQPAGVEVGQAAVPRRAVVEAEIVAGREGLPPHPKLSRILITPYMMNFLAGSQPKPCLRR